jgi:hypothetical protein
VALEGLQQADDTAIWHYAQINGFVIVSKDSDFQDRCRRSPEIEGSALGRISDKAPGSTSVLLLL